VNNIEKKIRYEAYKETKIHPPHCARTSVHRIYTFYSSIRNAVEIRPPLEFYTAQNGSMCQTDFLDCSPRNGGVILRCVNSQRCAHLIYTAAKA